MEQLPWHIAFQTPWGWSFLVLTLGLAFIFWRVNRTSEHLITVNREQQTHLLKVLGGQQVQYEKLAALLHSSVKQGHARGRADLQKSVSQLANENLALKRELGMIGAIPPEPNGNPLEQAMGRDSNAGDSTGGPSLRDMLPKTSSVRTGGPRESQ